MLASARPLSEPWMLVPGLACTYSDKKRNCLCTLGEKHLWPRDGKWTEIRSANPSPPPQAAKKTTRGKKQQPRRTPKEAQKRKYSLLAPQWWQRMARPPSEDKPPQRRRNVTNGPESWNGERKPHPKPAALFEQNVSIAGPGPPTNKQRTIHNRPPPISDL